MKEILEEIRIFVFGKEKTLTKTIINWGFILLLIAGFTEYGIDHNGDMSGLLKKETWETKPVESIEHPNDTIYIISVADIDVKDKDTKKDPHILLRRSFEVLVYHCISSFCLSVLFE